MCPFWPWIPSVAFSAFSIDLRNELGGGGRHWMESKVLGNRASFHMESTGHNTSDGVDVLKAYLRIEKVWSTSVITVAPTTLTSL